MLNQKMETVLIFFGIIFILISILICSMSIYRANLHKGEYESLPSRTSAITTRIQVVIADVLLFSMLKETIKNQ